jgi:hypothetical protein
MDRLTPTCPCIDAVAAIAASMDRPLLEGCGTAEVACNDPNQRLPLPIVILFRPRRRLGSPERFGVKSDHLLREESMRRFSICCAVGVGLLFGALVPTPASAYYYVHHYYHHGYYPYYHHRYYYPYHHHRYHHHGYYHHRYRY